MNVGIRQAFALAFLAMVMLSSSTYAQTVTGFEAPKIAFPDWWGLVVVGLALAILIISLSYMVGEAFNLPNVKAFAKQEVYELVSTVIVIAIVMGSLVAYGIFAKNVASSTMLSAPREGAIDSSITGICMENQHIYNIADSTQPENHLFAQTDWFLGCMPFTEDAVLISEEVAGQGFDLDYISAYDNMWEAQRTVLGQPEMSKGIMFGHMMNIYMSLFTLEFLLGPVSTFGVSAYLPEPLVSSISLDLAPNAGLTPVSDAMVMLTDMIGVGLVAVVVQKTVLQFVHQNALTVFLPLGIAFKAIPFTRKTGATLIALALVFYFIFPITLWINEQIYFNALWEKDAKPAMIDWTNYQSMLEICTPNPGETQAEFAARVQKNIAGPGGFEEQGQDVSDKIVETIWSDGKNSDPRVPASQQKAVSEAFVKNSGIVMNYMANFGAIFGPILPVEYFFSAIIDQFTTSMQWFALNLLFLANTIIICVTLFKDISIAIGGEPRIFGMSKLV
ncbi:MAG: hypothetical protein WC492_02195 [Candidatus Micrarchaeia archaeon]